MEDVDSERFVTRDYYIDSQVKLVTINQKRVRNILRNDASLVNVHIVDVVHDVDTAALTGVGWLDDPHVFLALVLLQLLVMVVKVTEFVRQDVGIGTEVQSRLAEALLQPNYIETESVLAGNLITLWEMVELLELIEAFVLVALAGTRTPQDVPLMRVGT